jgi:hypothetical protein
MPTLATDRKATQSIENVDSLLASIKKYYQIKHQKSHDASVHGFSFGQNPVCEHSISYSPFRGGHSYLTLNRINSDFVKKITGKTVSEIIKAEKLLRSEKGNGEANAYGITFDQSMEEFFHTHCIKLEIDSHSVGSVNFRFNIEMLTHDMLDAISETLKHTALLPNAQSTRTYEL